jgi:transposase
MDKIEDEIASVAATVAATEAAPMQRIEIVGERRRAHDAAFRARMVAASMVPGTRIRDLARQHGICSSLIYRWRREASPQVGASSAVRLVPVRVTEPRQTDRRGTAARPAAADVGRGGLMEIELAGGVRVRVDADVSPAALRRVLTALRG